MREMVAAFLFSLFLVAFILAFLKSTYVHVPNPCVVESTK